MEQQVVVDNTPWILKAFQEGGPVMGIILVIAVLTIGIVVAQYLNLKKLRIGRKEFIDSITGLIMRGDLRQAISLCDARPAPLTNTVKAGLVQVMNRRPDEEVQVAMDAAAMRETPRLEGATPFLAVTGNVAVLAGLLGTIIGMISSFQAVSQADPATKAEELSKGISHALNCTAFGLAVAIISIVFYGFYQQRVQSAENEVIESSMTMLNLVASNRDKLKD